MSDRLNEFYIFNTLFKKPNSNKQKDNFSKKIKCILINYDESSRL